MSFEIFIAGIFQGSLPGTEIHDQGYRQVIRDVLLEQFPEARLNCPAEEVPNSMNYQFVAGAEVYFDAMKRAARCDVMVAFTPEASMATAIEMWEAFKNNSIVICISPLKENWTVKFLSHKVFVSLEEFCDYVRSGDLKALVEKRRDQETPQA